MWRDETMAVRVDVVCHMFFVFLCLCRSFLVLCEECLVYDTPRISMFVMSMISN